jgi:hypothetical protein
LLPAKRKQGGWSNEGLERFNEHTTNIKVLRETEENSLKLEEKYMEMMEDDKGGMNKRSNSGGYKRDNKVVVTYDDLSLERVIPKKKQRHDDHVSHTGKSKKHRSSLESKFKQEQDFIEENEEEEVKNEEEDGDDSD